MRILFIIPGLSVGGQEKMGMILTSALLKYHEVTTVCFETENPLQYHYQTPIIRVTYHKNSNAVFKFLNIINRVRALRKIKRDYRPDVSISFGETAILANAFTYTKEKKIASIRQSLRFFTSMRSLYKKAYLLHDKIVPVNNAINNDLQQYYGIKNDRFIYNGYDIDTIKASAREDLPAAAETFFNGKVLAHTGRFDLPKGHWHLVSIFTKIKKQIPDAKLLLLGNYSAENAIFNYCINLLQKENITIGFLNSGQTDFTSVDVLIAGHQQNPFNFLAHADIFVFPSIWEGFPGALIEAMACGLPVVAADCATGPAEILSGPEGRNQYGTLMPAFDLDFNNGDVPTSSSEKEWVKEIVMMLSDEGKVAYYRSKSMQRAGDFTMEQNYRRWLELLEDTVKK